MISIRRALDDDFLKQELRKREELSLEALSAYASAVELMCEHMMRGCPPLIYRYGPQLRRIASQIQPEMAAADVIRLRQALMDTTSHYGQEAVEEYESTAKDIRDILRLATSATESLETQSAGTGEEWKRFSGEVERIAASEDLHEVRANLRREVKHMNECLQAMARDNAKVVRKLQSEMAVLRRRAAQAEGLAMEDPLTGLLNRRGVESAIIDRMVEHRQFCVVMFDINRFKRINELHGTHVADQVLREFADRLRRSIRDSDAAARWESDRFMALLDCELHVVVRRAQQIHSKVAGPYEVGEPPGSVLVDVHCAMGVVERRSGESIEALLDRTGKLLLVGKSQ